MAAPTLTAFAAPQGGAQGPSGGRAGAAVLVLVEHDNAAIASATLNTVTAAQRFGGKVDLLVAGHRCGAVADKASCADGHAQILAPTTTFGKNVAKRSSECTRRTARCRAR